jgi:diguanylate cyclase (GGDEF)-like protein
MSSSLEDMRASRRVMAYTAAAIYGATALDGVAEGFLPGDPKFSLVPVIVVVVIFGILVTVGPRMPRWALALLGPLGVALIAYALATTPGVGDGAVLYALPVLWTTLFFGLPGAIAIIGCVGMGHAIALILLPAGSSYPGRWVDVMVSVCSIAVVVLVLERRNEHLVTRLASEARTDALTGLLNRRGFHERASVELARVRREGGQIAVAVIDIDYFKRINDEWGHETGDRVLAHIGQLLSNESRDIDVVARLGGEEFTVLLAGSGSAAAYAFAERVRAALATCDSELPTVRVSIGVVASDGPTPVDQILQQADSALYAAKRAGRDRTMVAAIDQTAQRVPGGTLV